MIKNGISTQDIVEEVLGAGKAKSIDEIDKSLSSYAASRKDWSEVVPEAFSAYYSGVDNELADEIVKAVERRLLWMQTQS